MLGKKEEWIEKVGRMEDTLYNVCVNPSNTLRPRVMCFYGTLFLPSGGPFYVTCYDDKDHNIDITVYNYGPFYTSTGSWKVNFRIPGYADGVYKITDLDGVHEVVCGDIPEGIKPVVQEDYTDSYDIQGRKQNDNAHGIIIKDNRKVLKQ